MGSTGKNTPKSSSGLPESSSINSLDDVYELQSLMGQTGDEAGNPNASASNKIYANTGKSSNINAFLNSDGETFYSPNTDWSNYIGKSWIQNAIQKIDSGMKPLPKSIQTTRFLDGDALGKMLGNQSFNQANFNQLMDVLQTPGASTIAGNALSNALKGVDYTHKGYTSTTYTKNHGSYGDRDIRLNMVLRKGTPAIVTSNHKEHEILGGRNLKYNFTGDWKIETTASGKKQLVLDVYV